MALVEWLLPSMWVEPPTSSRWMAAQQLSIVLVKAQSGKYKHDDHNDQRQNLVICHYATSFVQDVRKGGEKPGAISQPCLAAKPPFLPGETPHGHFNMRKTILSTATALRRPPFCLPERAKYRKSARKPALRAPVSLGRGRETGTAAQVVALRAEPSGALQETGPSRLCQGDGFARRPPFFALTACGARPAAPGGCFSGSCSAGAARPAFPAGPRPRQAAPRARARPPRGRDRRRW